MSLYKNIFKDSFKLTWKNKYFWLLGIFTIFFSTSVEIDMFDNFFGPNRNYLYNYKALLENNLFKGGLFNALKDWVQTDTSFFYRIIIPVIVFLSIFFILLLISSIAQIIITNHSAGLIKNNTNSLKNPQRFNLLNTLKQIKSLVFPISLINLVLKLIINIALVIIVLPMIIKQANVITWSYVVLFITLFPAAIIIAFIARYISCYLIIQKQTFKQAFENGFRLFKNNWLVSIETSLMLFLINIFGSLGIIFIILAIANPVWFIGILFNQYIYKGSFYIVLAISYVFFFVLFALGASLLAVFNITSWTGLFLRIEKDKVDSKTVRIISNLTKK